MASRSGKTSEAKRLAHLRDQQQMTLFDGPTQSESVAKESPALSSNNQRSAFADDAKPVEDRIQSWPQYDVPAIVKVPGIDADDPIAKRFLLFHESCPKAYIAMKEAALAALLEHQQENVRRIGKGKKPEKLQLSSKAIHFEAKKKVGSINNDFTACYARLLDHYEPALEGVFEFRVRKGETPSE